MSHDRVLPDLDEGAIWIGQVSECDWPYAHSRAIGTCLTVIGLTSATSESEVVPTPVHSLTRGRSRGSGDCGACAASEGKPITKLLLREVFVVDCSVWPQRADHRERELRVIGVVPGLDVVDAGEETATGSLMPGHKVTNWIRHTKGLEVLWRSGKLRWPAEGVRYGGAQQGTSNPLVCDVPSRRCTLFHNPRHLPRASGK
jgi:hypothetical protein